MYSFISKVPLKSMIVGPAPPRTTLFVGFIAPKDGAHGACDSEVPVGKREKPHRAVRVLRQNSGEAARDPVAEALAHFGARDDDDAAGRGGALAALGACPCWCAHWAEVHVRSPTGDVAWAMRMQNNMSFDYLLESPLQDVAALLAVPAPAAPAPAPEARADEPRSRSGSGSSLAGRADLYKSRCVPANHSHPPLPAPR